MQTSAICDLSGNVHSPAILRLPAKALNSTIKGVTASTRLCRLDLVDDWIGAAKRARYSSPALAAICGISASQLRRYFQAEFGRAPQEWLNELRLWHAMELMCKGHIVKETAALLYFSCSAHFCRQFQTYHGCTPTISIQIYRIRVQEARERGAEDDEVLNPWKAAERRLATQISGKSSSIYLAAGPAC